MYPVKYPRTPHLPWSPGITSDDRVLHDLSFFEGKNVVVTEKMDGENMSLYRDYIHARSTEFLPMSEDRTWIKQFWETIRYDIPHDMRICGEYLYAAHSIRYDNLKSFFYGFGVWKGMTCLSWNETLEWFDLLGIIPVPVLYTGPWNVETLRRLESELDFDRTEGFVVRIQDEFSYDDFSKCVAKFVKKGHVQGVHWRKKKLVRNLLAE